MEFPAHRKSLLKMLADGRFHSGSDLAEALTVSRTAVWNLVRELKERGLDLSAVSGKGYRLAWPLELLDGETILAGLSQSASQRISALEIHDELDSTNTRLMGMAAGGAPSGAVCLAEHQTAGRGRIGRTWQSAYGGGICLSLLWRFEEQAAIAGLSLAVGVVILRALQQAGVEGAALKWPNDVLWRERKLAGILLEVSGEAHGRCAVVIGIGLNVRLPGQAAEKIDQAWTDLNQVAGGAPPSRNRLVSLLLEELTRLLADYPERGLRAYIEEWRRWHGHVGRAVELRSGNRIVRGVVAGVSDDGLLILDCGRDGMREFASGDLSLRLDQG